MEFIDTLIFDRGHGSLDTKGVYTTAPAKMHKFEDGVVAYEGVINSEYVKKMAFYGEAAGFNIEYTVLPTSPVDMPLEERVNKANFGLHKNNSLFISVHNNASLNHNAEGSEIWTSVGQTYSDIIAEHILDNWKSVFGNRVRKDMTDGDKDKEAKFYVLHNTVMPAVLLEIGFFDNRKDFEFITSYRTIDIISRLTIQGVVDALRKKFPEESKFLLNVVQ